MAPLRRYLRITKYSVLECRIYLDNPALTQSWLLNPRDPILPKVIKSVRPLVLPKLREEQERDRMKKKSKKRSIKDVVVQDDFEVSIFLTETDTRHSLLHKKKHFRDKVQTKLTSNSSKLTGGAHDAPIVVDGDEFILEAADGDDDVPMIREEDDNQNTINLDDIPAIDETTRNSAPANRRPKRQRQTSGEIEGAAVPSGVDPNIVETIDTDSSDGQLFVGDGEDDDGSDSDTAVGRPPPSKRRREKAAAQSTDGADDKKKMAMDISYEGFAIYGRVLCLVVKRREGGGKSGSFTMPTGGKSQAAGRPRGQAMMENWISSTQLPDEAGAGDEETSLAS
ncbi:hypothetical protein QBC40DRAFT_8265 [Triangularia verruculosa]|uniref:Uncharacterized protein n=1 Tax=Triangularia verruculosa TaxID=2587418 RepID=A0AAN7B0J5_9PEZI|nr:hypothetical protein QBC40DRAFT_8265 [Triangularia verruculosa]